MSDIVNTQRGIFFDGKKKPACGKSMRAVFRWRDNRLARGVLTNTTLRGIVGGMNILDRAINHVGGVSALSSRIGVKPNVVGNWRMRGRVPSEQVRAVEAACDGIVTRHDLRPDVFGPPGDRVKRPKHKAA